MEPTRPTSSIQVIDRMMWLLNAMAEYDDPVSLKYLSAETGLHPSTAFRILASLGEHGMVERTPQGLYVLGTTLGQLGRRVHSNQDVKVAARETMDWLRDELGETINLTIRQDDEVVYIERSLSPRMMRVEQVIGSKAPLHVTAVGKLFLAEEGEDGIRAYARRTGLPAYTDNTLTDEESLVEEGVHCRKNGYALDNQEAEIGVGCIGALIYGEGGVPIGGLSISAPIERRRDEWIPILHEAAARISRALGYTPPRSSTKVTT
ncbi:MAG: IclR family transcriptional regulator [Gammaproteobacteria bacterium]|nr:IclR family transcriptional regulator [Gammaproteobacteria bacterium]